MIKAREKIAELAPEARKAESDLTVTAKIDQAKEAIRMFVGGPRFVLCYSHFLLLCLFLQFEEMVEGEDRQKQKRREGFTDFLP